MPSVDREPVHLRNTFNIEEELMDVLMGHIRDYLDMSSRVVESEEHPCEDPEVLVVAHGVVWRSAREAVSVLRIKVSRQVGLDPLHCGHSRRNR